MRISLIVAAAAEGVIGRQGDLPWRMSSDLRRFKRLTMGHHVIMGRRTYESLGRPLPGREMVVLTRQSDYDAPGAVVAADLSEALRLAAGDDEVFIIGGAEVYRQALPLAKRIYFTRIDARIDGDAHFPAVDWSDWRLHSQQPHPAGPRDDYPSTFCVYDRIGTARSLAFPAATKTARP